MKVQGFKLWEILSRCLMRSLTQFSLGLAWASLSLVLKLWDREGLVRWRTLRLVLKIIYWFQDLISPCASLQRWKICIWEKNEKRWKEEVSGGNTDLAISAEVLTVPSWLKELGSSHQRMDGYELHNHPVGSASLWGEGALWIRCYACLTHLVINPDLSSLSLTLE